VGVEHENNAKSDLGAWQACGGEEQMRGGEEQGKISRHLSLMNMYAYPLVGSLKLQVSFAKEPYKKDDI